MYRPLLDMTLGGQTYSGPPWQMTLYQQEGGLDLCVLDITRQQVTPTRFAKGAPIAVSYGRSTALQALFPGYIDHVSSWRSPTEGLARVVCLSAGAQSMRDAASRVWPVGSSCDIAVEQIARQLHLSSLTESTSIPAPGGPVNESWWNYTRRAAAACGFTCYVSGTDLRFHSRRIDGSGNPVPWFTARADHTMRLFNSISSFEVTDSDDDTEVTHRKRRAFGVSDEGEFLTLTDSGDLASVGGVRQELPALTRNENMVVHDMGSAADYLTAAQEENRFAYHSRVVVSGDETVRQGSTIILRGSEYLNGYWYVLAATHTLTTSSYSMELSVGRDGRGDSAPADLSAPVPVIELGKHEPTPAPQPRLQIPAASLTDLIFPNNKMQWVAASAVNRKHYPYRAVVRG